VHPEDQDTVKQQVNELQDGTKMCLREFRLLGADGRVATVEASGTTILYMGEHAILFILRDITERKQAEEALRRSEAEARARADELTVLMDTVPAHIFIAHDPECRRISCSKKTYQFMHVPEGGNVSMSSPEEERPTSLRTLKDGKELRSDQLPMQIATAGREVHGFEFTLLFNDGTSRDLLGDAVPLFDDSGKVRGSVGIFLDITERKKEIDDHIQALEALRVRDQLLIHQGRLAAMGEMIGNIAHQWRQPLNTLALIIQELPAYFKLGKLDQQYLDESTKKAMQTISNMSQTIDDFRDFLKPDKTRVLFRVSEAVQKAVSLVEESFKVMGLKIQTVVEEEVSIEGCSNEYAQVILNILLNSKDALLEQKTECPLVVLRLFNEHGKAVLTVADNAGGIPEAIIDKIFDPYFTTKGPDKGTGIGLFMSKAIIEKNIGGKLTARNIGGGVEFRIEV
jgi:C4-dicarboxylate-specific signal transduction histidine kinase